MNEGWFITKEQMRVVLIGLTLPANEEQHINAITTVIDVLLTDELDLPKRTGIMSDLEIPGRAAELFASCRSDYTAHTRAVQITLASELRRLAPSDRNGLITYGALRRRADELDPPERTD